MPDTDENRNLFIQFIAQEVTMDGRIPHIDNSGIFALINEARRRARMLDRRNKSLTLRLRDMGGVIRAAGDIAVERGHELVTANDVKLAIKRSMTAEEQIREKFGALQGAVMGEMSESQSKQISPYNYWNENPDDIVGYE